MIKLDDFKCTYIIYEMAKTSQLHKLFLRDREQTEFISKVSSLEITEVEDHSLHQLMFYNDEFKFIIILFVLLKLIDKNHYTDSLKKASEQVEEVLRGNGSLPYLDSLNLMYKRYLTYGVDDVSFIKLLGYEDSIDKY